MPWELLPLALQGLLELALEGVQLTAEGDEAVKPAVHQTRVFHRWLLGRLSHDSDLNKTMRRLATKDLRSVC